MFDSSSPALIIAFITMLGLVTSLALVLREGAVFPREFLKKVSLEWLFVITTGIFHILAFAVNEPLFASNDKAGMLALPMATLIGLIICVFTVRKTREMISEARSLPEPLQAACDSF